MGSIPIQYRNAILQQCSRLRVRRGEILWAQGDPTEYVVFLAERILMSTYHSPNGKTGVTLVALTLETRGTFERVCGILLALSETFGINSDDGVLIDLHLTHADVAAMVGVSR